MDTDFSTRLYGQEMEQTEKNPNGFEKVEFRQNPEAKYPSQPILPTHKPNNSMSGHIHVYNKVLNNVKKVYNIQKQVLYTTE